MRPWALATAVVAFALLWTGRYRVIERALVALLPELPLAWVEFKVGQMGVFVVERHDLVTHNARIAALAAEREAPGSPPSRPAAPPEPPGDLF